jgi:membrane fusion protein, heavy metal efflux system
MYAAAVFSPKGEVQMTVDHNFRLRDVSALLCGGILLFLLSGCDHTAGQSVTNVLANEPLPNNPVQYAKVVDQTVPETLDLAARVQADPTKVIRIFPPASGRVVAIEVKPGDSVRRGQTVAILNSSDVASARSDYAKANIEADRARRAMERQKLLFEHGAAAEKDYIDARAQAESARAELTRTQQRLELLNVGISADTDRVSLVAPAAGVVLDVSAAPGEFSKSLESANPLVTIADLDTIWVIGDLYEKDAAKLSPGKPVTVTLQAYEGQQWSSHIDSVSGALDPTTRTLKVRVALPNPKRLLKPEMFGTIQVKVGAHQALVVPTAGIIREGNATNVFVRSNGKTEQRTVTVGQTVDGKAEILSGLRVGDEVASEGAELLQGGSPD